MGLRLKPNVTPVGGFIFTDAQITNDPIVAWSITEARDAVISRRRANPRFNLSTDPNAVVNEILTQNVNRLNGILKGPEARQAYLIEDASADPPAQSFQLPPLSARRDAVHVADRAQRVGVAVKVLYDWVGSGLKPVDLPVAEARAAVCVNCDMNKLGDFWQRIEAAAAAKIKQGIELKNSMNLKTSVDEQLRTCTACDCFNGLKIWVPIEHILQHDTTERRAKLDEGCWIRKEAGDDC